MDGTSQLQKIMMSLAYLADNPSRHWGRMLDRRNYELDAIPENGDTAYWRHDDWEMRATRNGNVTYFWWFSPSAYGQRQHQGLVVHRNAEGTIIKMVFSTVARSASCCYDVIYTPQGGRCEYTQRSQQNVTIDDPEAVTTSLETLDPLVIDLIVAMLPWWIHS